MRTEGERVTAAALDRFDEEEDEERCPFCGADGDEECEPDCESRDDED